MKATLPSSPILIPTFTYKHTSLPANQKKYHFPKWKKGKEPLSTKRATN